jgi:hypothetical protein
MKISDRYFSTKDTEDLRRIAATVTRSVQEGKKNNFETSKSFKKMLELEKSFVRVLKRYSVGVQCYSKFIYYITDELGNILNAKPYFRERSTTFNKFLSKAFKDKNPKGLMNFHPNYKFLQFCMKNMESIPPKIQEVYDKYTKIRQDIIENNIPLAINKSKLFNNITPKDHLDLIDFIGICVCGLADAIDKFVGDFSKANFANASINRMSGALLEEYNKGLISMYPKDKKIIYRIRSISWGTGITSPKELAHLFNRSLEEDKKLGRKPITRKKITEFEVVKLLNTAGILSLDFKVDDNSDDFSEKDYAGSSSYDEVYGEMITEEETVENKDIIIQARVVLEKMSIIEKKAVILKHPDLK